MHRLKIQRNYGILERHIIVVFDNTIVNKLLPLSEFLYTTMHASINEAQGTIEHRF